MGDFGTEIEKCRWQVAYFVTSQIKMIKNENEWCVPISCTVYNNSTKKSHFSTLRSERVTLSNQRYLNFHAKKVLKKTHTKLFLNTNAALHVHLHTNISKNSLFCQKKWCGKSWLFMNILLTQCLLLHHATFRTKNL